MNMARVRLLLALLTAVFTIEAAKAASRRGKRQADLSDLPDYALDEQDLMQPVFQTPLKRQWCRSGMSYNPILGTCTLSLAAMRGRSRGYRRF